MEKKKIYIVLKKMTEKGSLGSRDTPVSFLGGP
jgi:hypothetical protein